MINKSYRAAKGSFQDSWNNDVIAGFFPQIKVRGQWMYIWDKRSPIERKCFISKNEALKVAEQSYKGHKDAGSKYVRT